MFSVQFFRSPDVNINGATILPLSNAAKNVVAKLQQWQAAKKPRFGHHDSLAYGRKWYFEKGKIFDTSSNTPKTDGKIYSTGKSDIVDLTMKYPTVFGWDIGNYYASRDYVINGVVKTDLINHIKFVHQIGGINTISWHCPNPVREEGSGEFFKENDFNFYGGDVLNQINNAGTTNARFDNWLTNIVGFFQQINSLGIPIIFRPLHESNLNNTFWWDKSQANVSMFKNLWRALYQIIRARFSNILFCYSINDIWFGSNSSTPTNFDATFKQQFKNEFNNFYPGDDVVDIYGLDIYQKIGMLKGESETNFINRFKVSCQAMSEINASKPCIVSETGNYANTAITASNWWHTTFNNALTNTPIAYAMLWRNPCKFKDANSVCFGPFVSNANEASFKTFFNNNKHMFI